MILKDYLEQIEAGIQSMSEYPKYDNIWTIYDTMQRVVKYGTIEEID